MVFRSVLGSQFGNKVFVRGIQVPWHDRPRELQFGSSLSISIMPSSSLNGGLFSTTIFFSNYIDFRKLQCPSVDFQLCTAKNWTVRGKTSSLCSSKLFYTIRPSMGQNRDFRVNNIRKYYSHYRNKQKLSF